MARLGLIDSLVSRFRRNVAPTKTAGAMGTAVYGGFLEEKETSPKLQGREKYKTYSNILANTAIVAAGVRYYLNLVQKAKWSFNPVDDSDAAVEMAELIEEIINDMETPWSRVVRRAAMYKFYGFSVQEWTAKRREDGAFGLRDIAPRAQLTIEQWDIDETGRVVGVIQNSPQTNEGIYLPRSKLMYLCDDSLNDSPEGLGILRNIVEPARRLERVEQLEGFGFEADLRGVPVGRAPYKRLKELVDAGTMSEEEAQSQINALQTFIQKHIKNPERGVVLDSATYETTDEAQRPSNQPLWDLSLLESSSQGLEEANTTIERLNHEIARIMGVEHLLLGQTRGTQALAEDKSHNLALIIGSTLGEIEETVNRDIIQRLFELNGWDMELMPEAKVEELQFRDPKEITGALAELAKAALDPEDPAINVIRDLLGLPDALVADDMADASLTEPGGTQPNTKEPESTDDLTDE